MENYGQFSGWECCAKCMANFTITHISGNQYEFTDISSGSHTRSWASEDGGSDTSNPWIHTFPTDRMYWIDLTITLLDDTTCLVRKYIGDYLFCNHCVPNLVGETVYITIPTTSQGTIEECENIVEAVDGTWAIDNLFSGNGCTWGTTNYVLGTCVRCLAPYGDVGNHVLSGTVSISTSGFPTVTHVQIDATLQVSSSTSTDCNNSNGGGGAHYRLLIPVGSGVDCRGNHTLTKISETLFAHYIAWPDTISVFIPI